MVDRFTRKFAVITGAASGIGRATAQRLIGEGATVVALDRAPDRLSDLSSASADGRLASIICDVSDAGSVDRAIAGAIDRFGRIDCLLNNAGIGNVRRARLHEQPKSSTR